MTFIMLCAMCNVHIRFHQLIKSHRHEVGYSHVGDGHENKVLRLDNINAYGYKILSTLYSLPVAVFPSSSVLSLNCGVAHQLVGFQGSSRCRRRFACSWYLSVVRGKSSKALLNSWCKGSI